MGNKVSFRVYQDTLLISSDKLLHEPTMILASQGLPPATGGFPFQIHFRHHVNHFLARNDLSTKHIDPMAQYDHLPHWHKPPITISNIQ